ncbi:hypothetical protein RDI58_011067 [Solanum bulbocastanum]|uniref:Uncharacterized protein n=1 Tax=Solanum bulbocastanum TaxID=147425 RepID=A0AAN8TV03_SOLBU
MGNHEDIIPWTGDIIHFSHASYSRFKSTFRYGNGTKLEKSSKGSSNIKNQGIIRRTNPKRGVKKKETRNQQSEPILRRKSQNADLESEAIEWENMRKSSSFVNPKERNDSTLDAIDCHAVHSATMDQVSKAIMQRAMDKKLALRIKGVLPKHLWFGSEKCGMNKVDTNVGRVLVRLGWIPIQPLPRGQEMHLLTMYPDVKDVHKYLWPRLCTLNYLTLARLSPGPGENSSANVETALVPVDSACSCADSSQAQLVSSFGEASNSQHSMGDHQNELITYPALECIGETDIEDYCASNIPTTTFDSQAFMENLLRYIDENDLSTKDTDLSKALVIATQEAPLPKLKHMGRLRTEHQVYELPDSHPLLEGLEKQEPEDPCPYLLAIRTPASEEPTKEKCESCNCDETPNKINASNVSTGNNIETISGTLLVFADEESTLQPIEVPRQGRLKPVGGLRPKSN